MPEIIKKLKEGYESRSVLIIEDDPEVAKSLAKILQIFFKECVVTTDGISGFEVFLSRFHSDDPFTLVVTDLELPKMGGLRIIREIKSIVKEQAILILSAHDEAEFMAEAVRLEVSSYLLKPLSMPKLFESLEKIFNKLSKVKKDIKTDIDEVTGWKKDFSLSEKLSDENLTSTTILCLRINHLSNMFNIVGKVISNGYLLELANLLKSLLLEEHGEFYKTATDEICLVLEGEQIEYATALAKNMLSVVRYFHTSEQGIILNSTLSIGIAHGSENTLLHAKLALTKINNNIGGVMVFSQNQEHKDYAFIEGRDILKMISSALNHENIVPFVQPIVDVKTGEYKIYQALIRIREDNQIYGPETFLRLTMDMGQMPMVTRSMIKNSFQLTTKLPENSMICTSLSSYDLNDEGLIPYIRFWAERYNISPSNIAFQITNEIDTLENKHIFEVIKELQSIGYKIILNEFGLSKCNFRNLLELSPDFIKLQVDSIQNLQGDEKMVAIAHHIIEIAHAIGSKVIVSHLSNTEQVKLIESAKIDYMQGFAIKIPYEVKNV